jgi:hypothetical protein
MLRRVEHIDVTGTSSSNGPVQPVRTREILIEWKCRPERNQCPGLLWVLKLPDDRIHVLSHGERDSEGLISGWQETAWAAGPIRRVSDGRVTEPRGNRDARETRTLRERW